MDPNDANGVSNDERPHPSNEVTPLRSHQRGLSW